MSKRHVRKMLRQMEGGEPVHLTVAMTTWKGLTQLAFVAEQFGYEYTDLQPTGDHKFVLSIVPDPSPEARERAAQNWARYPDARDGVSLPPVVPDAIELLKARMWFDFGRSFTDKQWMAIGVVLLISSAAAFAFRFRADTDVAVIGVIVHAALMALLPAGLATRRHYKTKAVAQLEAAGFTPVTDLNGRLRYVRPGGRLPGHGNPFARGA